LLCLVGAVATTTPAGAAVAGSGTSLVSTSLVTVDVGEGLLGIRVLGDDSRSNLDKLQGVPEASTVLRPLEITSNVAALSALNKAIPPVEVRSQGAEDKKDAGIDLGSLGLPQVASGQLTPASLSAIVDSVSARSGMLSALSDLALVGGLADVDSVATLLGTAAATGSSDAVRALDVGAVGALNLGALLTGLGLDIDNLSLAMVEDLLAELDLLGAGSPVATLFTTLGLGAAPTDAAGLDTAVTNVLATLSGANSDLAALDAAFPGVLCDAVTPVVDPLASLIGITPGTVCATARTTLVGQQTAAAGDVTGLLGGLASILDGTELLSLDGIGAGVTAKATDDINTSVAKVTAAVGDLSIGGLTVPGVDLLATAQQLASTADSVVASIDDVLGTIDPALAGVIDVKLLDTSGTGVTKQNGYVRSVAKLVGANVSITPPANLAAIVTGLADGTSITEALTAAVPGASLPALPNAAGMQALETVLAAGGPVVQALAGGADVQVAGVTATATFLPGPVSPAPSSPTGSLPRTGGSTGMAAIAAGLLAVLAIAVRRQVLLPSRTD
jgi:hypothetical protein